MLSCRAVIMLLPGRSGSIWRLDPTGPKLTCGIGVDRPVNTDAAVSVKCLDPATAAACCSLLWGGMLVGRVEAARGLVALQVIRFAGVVKASSHVALPAAGNSRGG